VTGKLARWFRATTPRPRKESPPPLGPLEWLEERNAPDSLLELAGFALFGPNLLGWDARPRDEAKEAASPRLATPFDQQRVAESVPFVFLVDQQASTVQREAPQAPPATMPAPAVRTEAGFQEQSTSNPDGSTGVAALLAQAFASPARGNTSSAVEAGNIPPTAPQGEPAHGAAPAGIPAGSSSLPASLPGWQGALQGAVSPTSGSTGAGTSGIGPGAKPGGNGGGGGSFGPNVFNWQFTAYESLSGISQLYPPRPSVLNVAGDAGLLSNAIPEVPGDSLVASLPSGTETARTNHGFVIVGGDGSFSYRPDDDYVGTDSFSFSVLDPGTGNSSSGMVQINVIGQSRGYLTPPDVNLETGADLWPKMHHDTLDTGDAPWFQRVQSRVTDTIAFGSPGIRTFNTTGFNPYPGIPVQPPYVGSPVIGIGPGSFPAVFVETDNGMPDPYHEHGLKAVSIGGQVLWNNPSFSRPVVPYQTVYRAPLLAQSPSSPDPTYVVLGNQNGQLLLLNGDDGTIASSFTPSDDGTGVIAGSPTLGWSLNSANGPPVSGAPTYHGMPDSAMFVFGTDFQQHDWQGNPGPSLGRLYAVRDDDTVAWMTLTAGVIHGSPGITPSNSLVPGNRSYVYIGTGPNQWTGPPQPGYDLGRFYKLDLMTGKVVAGVTTDGQATVHSATAIPGMTNGQVDYDSPDARIFVTSIDGRVMAYQPTLQRAWEALMLYPNPTSPALSPDPTNNRVIYVGGMHEVRALNADTGATVWQLRLGGKETGSVSVAWDPLRTADTLQLQWEVVFGTVPLLPTDPPPPPVIDIGGNVVVGADGRTGTVIDESANYPDRGFTSAPAIGWPQVGQAGLQASIWMTTDHDQLMSLG
jgi:hypothetical protein